MEEGCVCVCVCRRGEECARERVGKREETGMLFAHSGVYVCVFCDGTLLIGIKPWYYYFEHKTIVLILIFLWVFPLKTFRKWGFLLFEPRRTTIPTLRVISVSIVTEALLIACFWGLSGRVSADEKGLGCIAHRWPDLVFPISAPDSDPRPFEGCAGSINRLVFRTHQSPITPHPGVGRAAAAAAAVCWTFQKRQIVLSTPGVR